MADQLDAMHRRVRRLGQLNRRACMQSTDRTRKKAAAVYFRHSQNSLAFPTS
jgi:hypothetical protein